MQTNIICVGKLKETYFINTQKEYEKRLSKFTSLNIIEVNDEKIQDKPTNTQIEIVKNKEGEKILKNIQKGFTIFPLSKDGKSYDSHNFSKVISNNAKCTFIIGGSVGLSNNILSHGHNISFSTLTFPHQLMRIILLEQIFRSYKIINNEPYHK